MFLVLQGDQTPCRLICVDLFLMIHIASWFFVHETCVSSIVAQVLSPVNKFLFWVWDLEFCISWFDFFFCDLDYGFRILYSLFWNIGFGIWILKSGFFIFVPFNALVRDLWKTEVGAHLGLFSWGFAFPVIVLGDSCHWSAHYSL